MLSERAQQQQQKNITIPQRKWIFMLYCLMYHLHTTFKRIKTNKCSKQKQFLIIKEIYKKKDVWIWRAQK